ncbi:sulfurtransferase [Lujinxingia litoralis]|nr:rhodanese-like domain-containing protein [Lujinxingia litoralis]
MVRGWIGGTMVALALALSAGCGQEVTELATPEGCSEESGTCQARIFLQADEFEFLRRQGALVLDARASEAFVQGHVPGAIRVDWKAFAREGFNGLIEDDVETLERVARGYGINEDQPVLIYGGGGSAESVSGRVFWTLEYLGHDQVYLLEGGFDSWKQARFAAIEAGVTEAGAGDFTVELQPQRRATQQEVEAAIEDETLRLVDTRTIEEWFAENLRDNPEGGHIPEAVHYHWENVLEADGTLRPAADIRAELEALGIDEGTLAIPYCQSGVRSGFFYAVLKWLEYPEPKNYDGSWWEWSRDEATVKVVEARD